MAYELFWERPCFEELGALRRAGIPAERLKQAVLGINAQLQIDPETKGRELAEGLRRLDYPPFRVYYHVAKVERRVTVSVLHWQPE